MSAIDDLRHIDSINKAHSSEGSGLVVRAILDLDRQQKEESLKIAALLLNLAARLDEHITNHPESNRGRPPITDGPNSASEVCKECGKFHSIYADCQPVPVQPNNRDEELVEKWTIAIYNEYWEQDNTMSTDKLGWLKPIIRAIIKEAREG